MKASMFRGRRATRALGVAVVVGALGVSIPVFANLPNSAFDAGDGNLVLDDEAKDWVNAPNFAKRIDKLKGQGDDAMGNGTAEDTLVPSMVEDGITPQAVSTYKEDESTAAFLNGDAVFLRNWPYVYAQAGDSTVSSITQDQVGIAPLPASSGGESVSGLGGWNLMINALADPEIQDASYELISFMTAPEQQRRLATEGSYLPILQELYDDQEVQDAVPVVALGAEAIQNTVPRPVSPFYSDMSLVMAEQFNASLNGEEDPETVTSTLQQELTDIIEQGQGLA